MVRKGVSEKECQLPPDGERGQARAELGVRGGFLAEGAVSTKATRLGEAHVAMLEGNREAQRV